MFEREITDALFVQRWGIVRTLMPQSIAEHMFSVAHYANDIAVNLDLDDGLSLAILRYAIWHDLTDEIFTGDLPGPNKRGLLDAIGPDAKDKWDAKLGVWADSVFADLSKRSGGKHDPGRALVIKLVIKTADWLEASVRMATETQMGNRCAERHIVPNMNGALESAKSLIEVLFEDEQVRTHNLVVLSRAVRGCVDDALSGHSRSPWITKEDDSRSYRDPALGDTSEGLR